MTALAIQDGALLVCDGSLSSECCDLPPGLEACCLPNGSCADLPPDQCLAQGGIPMGQGTVCSPELCEITACPTSCPQQFLTVNIAGFEMVCGEFSWSGDCSIQVQQVQPCVWATPGASDPCGAAQGGCESRARVLALRCGFLNEGWTCNFGIDCVGGAPLSTLFCTFNYSKPNFASNPGPVGHYVFLSHACGPCEDAVVTFGSISVSG